MPQFRVVRQKSQLGTVACLRQFFPVADLREPIHFVNAFQQRLPFELVYFLPAQKIVAPLHQRHFQVRRKIFLQKWHILIEQLLLQGLCSCRNDDASPAANRRNQIRQGLAGPSARLDNRVLMLLKSLIHDLGHSELRRTKFVSRVPAFQQSASPKDPLDRHILGFRSCSSFFRHWVKCRNQEWLCALNFKILHATGAGRCAIKSLRRRPARSFASPSHPFVPPRPYVLM